MNRSLARAARLVALCLCLALLLGGCAKWPVGWRVDDLVPQPARPAALPTQRALYLVPLEDAAFGVAAMAAVVDAEGNVLQEGEGLSLLRDAATGGVMGIVQQMGEIEGARYGRRLARLYDVEGNLLRQWQPVAYLGGAGNLVLEAADTTYGGWLAAKEARSLVDMTTGDTVLEGVRWLDELGEGRAVAVNEDGYVAAILRADGTMDTSIPVETYTSLVAHRNYYIATKGNAGWVGILDPAFRVLYSLEDGYITTSGEWFIAWDGARQRSVVLSMPTGETVFEAPGGSVLYCDGRFVVVEGDTGEHSTLYTLGGEKVLESAGFLLPDARAEGEAASFVACDGGSLRYVDTDGQVLASRTDIAPQWGQQVANGRFVLAEDPKTPDGESGWSVTLVDENLEPLTAAGDYIEITPLEGGPKGLLLAGRSISYLNMRYDLLDTDGRVLIEGLSEVAACDEERLVVKRGFSVGLMDYEGNWLFKRGAFGSLEDE